MTDPAVFREQLDTIFLVDLDSRSIPLRLTEVTEVPPTSGLLQFSLFFHGPSDRVLEQGLYDLRHEALGSLSLFIVPVVGSNADRIVYQACFSLRVPPSE